MFRQPSTRRYRNEGFNLRDQLLILLVFAVFLWFLHLWMQPTDGVKVLKERNASVEEQLQKRQKGLKLGRKDLPELEEVSDRDDLNDQSEESGNEVVGDDDGAQNEEFGADHDSQPQNRQKRLKLGRKDLPELEAVSDGDELNNLSEESGDQVVGDEDDTQNEEVGADQRSQPQNRQERTKLGGKDLREREEESVRNDLNYHSNESSDQIVRDDSQQEENDNESGVDDKDRIDGKKASEESFGLGEVYEDSDLNYRSKDIEQNGNGTGWDYFEDQTIEDSAKESKKEDNAEGESSEATTNEQGDGDKHEDIGVTNGNSQEANDFKDEMHLVNLDGQRGSEINSEISYQEDNGNGDNIAKDDDNQIDEHAADTSMESTDSQDANGSNVNGRDDGSKITDLPGDDGAMISIVDEKDDQTPSESTGSVAVDWVDTFIPEEETTYSDQNAVSKFDTALHNSIFMEQISNVITDRDSKELANKVRLEKSKGNGDGFDELAVGNNAAVTVDDF